MINPGAVGVALKIVGFEDSFSLPVRLGNEAIMLFERIVRTPNIFSRVSPGLLAQSLRNALLECRQIDLSSYDRSWHDAIKDLNGILLHCLEGCDAIQARDMDHLRRCIQGISHRISSFNLAIQDPGLITAVVSREWIEEVENRLNAMSDKDIARVEKIAEALAVLIEALSVVSDKVSLRAEGTEDFPDPDKITRWDSIDVDADMRHPQETMLVAFRFLKDVYLNGLRPTQEAELDSIIEEARKSLSSISERYGIC